jgi:hypothetical protein
MRPTLLAHLLTRPRWLLGILADGAGFALQFAALGMGSLAVVQPLLVSGLLFALPLDAVLAERRLARGDFRAAVLVVFGLAMFLLVAHPARGRATATTAQWVAIAVVTVAPGAILAAWAMSTRGRSRAVALGAAAGLLYAFTAALSKEVAHLLGGGVGTVVAGWQLYALISVGAAGMLCAQSAFQAAPLDASLPALSVVDPLASALIGALAFHEALAATPVAIAAEVVAVALVVIGVISLNRPTVTAAPTA